MTKYRAVVCDIDGTILDGNHRIPVELIELVDQLHARGVLFTLASARPARSVMQLGRQLNIQCPVICHNGSLLVDQNKHICHNQEFSVGCLQQLLTAFPHIQISSYHCFDWYINRYTPVVAVEEQYVELTAQMVNQLPDLTNMVVLTAAHNELLVVQQYVRKHEPMLAAVFSHPEYLHIGQQGIGKSHGLRVLADLYQLELSHFIAFGDGENDICMLQSVGHGVAMANAGPTVKQAASAVAGHHAQLGVVDYLRQLLVAEKIG